MTECVPGCGACCDPVTIYALPADMDGPSGPFAREHWTLLSEQEHPLGVEYSMRCDAFDPHTRQCTAYENRPPICSGYPAYEAGTLTRGHWRRNTLPLVCAFQADVRTVLPLVSVTHGG